jgi:hypothetical protein
VGNIALGILLGRLWFLGATWPIVGGAYLILSSLARFVEEQYRGEPQTPWRFGLAIYQWLAALMLVTGLGIVCVPGAPVHMFRWISWETVAISAVVGLVAGTLMSIDFPESQWRFSRLTVTG